ncbi:MAG: polysaccharide biosynthesis C-terminal domain-containing protein [Nitrospiraceae bacterium]|nr:polysaccharide biosynthesis C-terminal domain-containing protein [Nitrospiraceae bacterium]
MSAKRIAKGIVSVGTWSATKLVVAGLALPLYSRLLGIDGYGQYAYYVALLMICVHPANFGMRQMLTKHIAERPEERPRARGLASFAARVTLVSSLVVGLVASLLQVSAAYWKLQTAGMMLLVVGTLWAQQVHQHAAGILHGLHREDEETLPASMGIALSGLAGILLAALGFGVAGVLIGMLTGTVLVAVVTLRRAAAALDESGGEATADPVPRRELLLFGMVSMGYTGMAMVLYSVDVVLVRHFSGDQQTGLYAAAVQWSEFVWFVPIAIEGVMLQSTARLWAENRLDELSRLVSRLMRYVMVSTAYLLIVVMVFASQTVTLYFGPQFEQAAVPLQLLVPGVFAFSLARVMRPVIQAHGWVATLFKTVSAATLVNVVLNVVLVPRWGAAGASVATSASFLMVTISYVLLLRREGVRPFEEFPFGRFGLLCGVTVTVLMPIGLLITEPLVALTTGVVLSVALYWGGVFWLGLIRIRELEQIVDSLPGALRPTAVKVMGYLQPLLGRLSVMAPN